MPSLFDAARTCLDAASPDDKLARTFATAAAFARGELTIPDNAPTPEPIRMPGRPPRPRLVPVRELPQRGFGSSEGRAVFVHAIAHIDGEEAARRIKAIVKEPEIGEEYHGRVVSIQAFGAFVELIPGKDGLLHISRVANGRVGKVEDVLAVGDEVHVKIIDIDDRGKVSLDRLDKPDAPAGSADSAPSGGDRDRGPRREGGGGDRDRKPRRHH